TAGGDRSQPPVVWQGQELPSMAVVLLSKEDRISDGDIERLMPFATQAGVALARASDVEMLRSSTEQYAIEKEWLWWMLTAVDEEIRLERDRLNLILGSVPNPILVVDNDNQIIRMNEQAQRLLPPVNPNNSMVMPVSRREQIAASNGAKLTSFLGQLRIEPAQ